MDTTEIVIRIADRHYIAALLIDGLVSRRTVSDKWPEMAVWAHRIRQELGSDIHARLKSSRTNPMGTTLALARYLDREGFTVGIERDRAHCPQPPLQLQ